MMFYWLQNGLEALLTLLLVLSGTGVAYMACQAVRRAYSDCHPKN